MMDRASRLAARDARTAANRARLQASRDAMNQRRAAKGKKAIDYAAADARYGRYGMKSGGDVKKMQVGGMASKLASIREDQAARRARNQERLNRVRAARERFAARKASMKSGSNVKKMAGGGMSSSYRKAADGVATRGKTRGTEIKMRKGGMC